jgi:hypothetical protein
MVITSLLLIEKEFRSRNKEAGDSNPPLVEDH